MSTNFGSNLALSHYASHQSTGRAMAIGCAMTIAASIMCMLNVWWASL